MEQVLTIISEYWVIILAVLTLLTYIAEWTGWEWLDTLVDVVKNILNLFMPGKKLYTLEDIKGKTELELEMGEKVYKEKKALGRIAELPKRIIRKKQEA